MRTITWPSGLEQPATTASTSCRARPLPDTIRPCDTVAPRTDHVDNTVFPVHHVAACCVVGTLAWAALITASRFALSIVTQLA